MKKFLERKGRTIMYASKNHMSKQANSDGYNRCQLDITENCFNRRRKKKTTDEEVVISRHEATKPRIQKKRNYSEQPGKNVCCPCSC